jgi:hypothetical protein
MTISIDANVLGALWNDNELMNPAVTQLLGDLMQRDQLLVSGIVYAELMAGPLRKESNLDLFFQETGIVVDWSLEENIFREAGRAYAEYARRRRKDGKPDPRRILADFMIGAHALVRGYSLLTIDDQHFRTAFPKLNVIPV